MAFPASVVVPFGEFRGAGMRVLPETWSKRAGQFVLDADAAAARGALDAPRILFSRDFIRKQVDHFDGFNIRVRHFRCVENWFVETDASGEIQAVAAVEGLKRLRPVVQVNLLAVRGVEPVAAQEEEKLTGLLARLLGLIAEFGTTHKLRFTYLWDTERRVPVAGRVCDAMLHPGPASPFVEEARIAHETGHGREAVLLAYLGRPPEEKQ